ncbi:MAG: DUF4365 domain-containing protein, partial [Planctomycetaceae bacterium]
SFDVKVKNYHDLRDDTVMVPRILVVVLVPDHITEWIHHSEPEMALRRCGYWISLRGYPDTQNLRSVAVNVDRTRQFNPANLAQIMQRLRTGGMP